MTPSPDAPDLTGLAADAMFQATYERLRELAAGYYRDEASKVTLQPTAIVHEAYVRLSKDPNLRFRDRRHFLSFAARVMRQVLVDEARRRQSQKRGARPLRTTFVDGLQLQMPDSVEILDLDAAIEELAERDEQKALIAQFRFFGGLTVDETATTIGVSVSTIHREWRLSRAWLAKRLERATQSAEHQDPGRE